KAGVTINPATPVEMIQPILPDVDLVLLMCGNPRVGGQSFIHQTDDKINEVAHWRKERGLTVDIEVEGGVNVETAKRCVDAGADVLVAGSAIFNEEDRKQAIQNIIRATRISE